MFMFDMFCSLAVVTPAKYECEFNLDFCENRNFTY